MITFKQLEELKADPAFNDPAVVHMICGHSVPNTGDIVVFNYYDGRKVMTRKVTGHDMQIDTSGQLPHGVTYWFSYVDGSRTCCMGCAKRYYPGEIAS